MSDEFVFESIAAAGGHVDVVFVHGLRGDLKGSWISSGSGEPEGDYWPLWLAKDIPGINVYALGYPASIFAQWAKGEMGLFERAKAVLEYMASKGFGAKPIALITHSLGGLLAKQVIRTAIDNPNTAWNSIAQNCKAIFFIATPHSGASLAALLKFAVPRLISKHVETLNQGCDQLNELNETYRNLALRLGITTFPYYEKYRTNNVSLVVTRESADPGCGENQPIPIDADHISICKPKNREALLYCSIKSHLSKFVSSSNDNTQGTISTDSDLVDAFDNDGLTDPSDLDRRTLYQKMVAAKREHEYEKANKLQNNFAQNYYRLGLFPSARQINDDLLSDVAQRFDTHVFSKICQGASESEINIALQTLVIDPLVQKYSSISNANSQSVLKALYFLTERCHIRWDAT
ncbi:ABC-three component system protein [Dongia soli]|uniref:ABC-three component system protein n=1 Tax=Dongia soli TaxID=600628 RepID=A0ABU5EF13_9PROT|nr:ABC-three component system protein [Dongia soli]MDY0884685.1 ABC-three component system protein [Dongia soli]